MFFVYYRTEMPVQPVERITAIPRCQTEVNGDYLTETPHYIRDSNVTSFSKCICLTSL